MRRFVVGEPYEENRMDLSIRGKSNGACTDAIIKYDRRSRSENCEFRQSHFWRLQNGIA
jgi:hypothetical protein